MCTVQRPSLPRPTWLRLPLFALHVLSCYQVEHLIGIIELGFVLPAMPGVSDPPGCTSRCVGRVASTHFFQRRVFPNTRRVHMCFEAD